MGTKWINSSRTPLRITYIKIEHDKKVALLKKLEITREYELMIEKTKANVKHLQSHIIVAFQRVDTLICKTCRYINTMNYKYGMV